MASVSLVLRYVVVLTFLILLNTEETFSSRLVRSPAKIAEIGADDYPSSGRNSPVRDLGFPEFPSYQDGLASPPPPPELPLLSPPPPPPPTFPDPERPRFPVPVWPSLPYFPPFPFVDQATPSEPLDPRFEESENWMPSTPSNSQGLP